MDETPRTEQPVTPPPSNESDVEQARSTAWLSYLIVLWVVPLLIMKDNPFARFHVKQGIVLTLLLVVAWVVGTIPLIGVVAKTLIYVFVVVMAILGIVNSLNGNYWKMPIAGKWAADWFKF